MAEALSLAFGLGLAGGLVAIAFALLSAAVGIFALAPVEWLPAKRRRGVFLLSRVLFVLNLLPHALSLIAFSWASGPIDGLMMLCIQLLGLPGVLIVALWFAGQRIRRAIPRTIAAPSDFCLCSICAEPVARNARYCEHCGSS